MNADAPMNEEEPSLKRLRGGDDDPLLDSTAAAPPPLVAPAVVRPFRAMASVVKLFVVQAEPNYAQPWQVRPQRSGTGSGFVIDKRRIITNAHVVVSFTTVHVRRLGRPKKYPARVLSIAHQLDLAILTVDDEQFWDGLTPLTFADVPQLQDSVVVVGYPVGGDSISVTKGVVSRVDMRAYSHGGNTLLTVQIDAAINPGNSGGPAFSDVEARITCEDPTNAGKVVGVAFSKLRHSDNIGYIIPNEVVSHFLQEVDAFGTFRGVIGRGFQWQKMENSFLREHYGMANEQSGVMVARVDPLSPAAGVLREKDILMEIDGVPIADDGTIEFRGEERLDFTHVLRRRHCGDSAGARVLRGGAEIGVDFLLARPVPLVPIMHSVDCFPSFLIVGGFVFLPLSLPFLEHGYGTSWRKLCPPKLMALIGEYRGFRDEQVVLLFQILSAELNYGYKGQSMWVKQFNGQPVRNLAHMAALVDDCQERWLLWETDDGSTLVLDRAAAKRDSPAILKQHAIAYDRSADLRGEARVVSRVAARLRPVELSLPISLCTDLKQAF